MNQEEFNNLTNSLKEKLGDENTALISDELASIINNSNSMYQTIRNNEDTITKIKKEKEDLISTNGKLLQQIPVGFEKEEKEEKEEKKNVSFKDFFDENGKFKK